MGRFHLFSFPLLFLSPAPLAHILHYGDSLICLLNAEWTIDRTHVLLSIMPSRSVPGLPGPRGCLSALAWTKPIAFPTVYSDSCTAAAEANKTWRAKAKQNKEN